MSVGRVVQFQDGGEGDLAAKPSSGDAGSVQAWSFDSYYDRWSESVYRYLVHLVGDATQAEDLFQETWIKAIENLDQLRSADRFGPWVMRIARNQAFNHLRKRRQNLQIWILSNLATPDGRVIDDFLDRQPSVSPSPRDNAVGSQRREIVQKAIGELDLITQEMLQLRYFEQRTLAEIAEILNVPLGTVCTKVHRSLKAIRQNLERQGLRTVQEI